MGSQAQPGAAGVFQSTAYRGGNTMQQAQEPHGATRREFIKLAGLGAGAAVLAPALPAADAAPGASLPLGDAPGASLPARVSPYRVGKWLPSDQAQLERWLAGQIEAVAADPKPLHPVLQEFQALIESDPQITMYFHQMFEQLPHDALFQATPMGRPQVRDYRHMLELINAVMTTAPVFDKGGLVGFPINAILDWPMGTPGGFAAFLNDKVNAQLKKVLNTWGRFLTSPDSRYVLSDDPASGWFGRDALAAMPGFADLFECDPSQPYYGFQSWARRQMGRPFLDQGPALLAAPHVRRRPGGRAVCGRLDLPGVFERAQLPPLAQPGQRRSRQGGCGGRQLLFRAAQRRL
jgi:hypothetical protein